MRPTTLASLLIFSSLLFITPLPSSQNGRLPEPGRAKPSPLQEESPCYRKGVESMALSPDGRQVLTGGHEWGIRLFDLASGKEIHSFKGHEHDYLQVAFAPDGHRALSYGFAKFIYLWDVESGLEIRRFAGHVGGTQSASFTTDGRLLVTAGAIDAMVRVLDVESGRELRSFKVIEKDDYAQVNISPTGRRALSQTREGTVCLWDTALGKTIRCFNVSEDTDFFVPFGRHAVFQNSKLDALRLLDMESGQEVAHVDEFKEMSVDSLSTNGYLALVSNKTEDAPPRLLDLRNRREYVHLEINKDERMSPFEFTSDGLYAVAGSTEETFCLWDLKSGRRLRCFKAESK